MRSAKQWRSGMVDVVLGLFVAGASCVLQIGCNGDGSSTSSGWRAGVYRGENSYCTSGAGSTECVTDEITLEVHEDGRVTFLEIVEQVGENLGVTFEYSGTISGFTIRHTFPTGAWVPGSTLPPIVHTYTGSWTGSMIEGTMSSVTPVAGVTITQQGTFWAERTDDSGDVDWGSLTNQNWNL